jgi:hypothetical protein
LTVFEPSAVTEVQVPLGLVAVEIFPAAPVSTQRPVVEVVEGAQETERGVAMPVLTLVQETLLKGVAVQSTLAPSTWAQKVVEVQETLLKMVPLLLSSVQLLTVVPLTAAISTWPPPVVTRQLVADRQETASPVESGAVAETHEPAPPVGSVARLMAVVLLAAMQSPVVPVVPGSQEMPTKAGLPETAVTVQVGVAEVGLVEV